MKNEDGITVKHGVKKSFSEIVTVGKDSVSMIRDLFLLLLALLLVAFPSTFNNLLMSAGFEEGSFAGLKWKAKLDASSSSLNDARMTINDLKKHVDETTNALAEAQTKLNDPALKDKLNKIEEQGRELDAVSSKVVESVNHTISSNAQYVEKAQNSVDTDAKWGVVYSGDATPDLAKYEVTNVAKMYEIPNPTIYLRQGFYRSVAVVDNRAEAEQVLPRARKRRPDAYIVNMSSWCPNAGKPDDYMECK